MYFLFWMPKTQINAEISLYRYTFLTAISFLSIKQTYSIFNHVNFKVYESKSNVYEIKTTFKFVCSTCLYEYHLSKLPHSRLVFKVVDLNSTLFVIMYEEI